MSKAPDGFIGMDEAVEELMRRTGCSRRSARRQLAKHINSGALPIKRGPVRDPITEPVDGETAAKLLQDDPDALLISLAEVMRHYRLSPDELLGELRSGRLKACVVGPEDLHVKVEADRQAGRCSPDAFSVTGTAMQEWFESDLPEHIRAKVEHRVH